MITQAKLERIREVMRDIQTDCDADALRIDGAPVSGLVHGELLGGLLAAVQAIARAVETLAAGRIEP